MATMLPQQQQQQQQQPPPPSSRMTHDFAPSSPPDRVPYHHHHQQQQQQQDNLSGPPLHYRSSLEFRRSGPGFANGNTALAPPHIPQPMPNGVPRHRGTMSLGAFEGGKSPPNTKNTSHVPCKFFRTGQCQAGPACPFSHSIDNSTVDTPCKYFAKGNCKFGQKCALAHVLPDGRVVNRPNGVIRNNVSLGPRIDPQLYQQSDPILAQSLLAQQGNGIPPPFSQKFAPYSDIDPTLQQDNLTPRPFDRLPHRENDYLGDPDLKYGSPREESRYTSFSPNGRLNVLDAPLPASFDSQGVSWARQFGHVAASLPSKLGLLESSPAGSLPQKNHVPLDSIRNLQAPSFSGRESRPRREDLGSSPLGSGDEGYGQRFTHSRRIPKAKMLSTSMPRVDLPVDDSDSDFHFSGGEEDYIPAGLHDQIFTRDEQRQRRNSRTEQDRRGVMESLSGIVTPADSSKVGSPSTGSPASRYGGLFTRQQQEQAGGNAAGSPSAFGHVGSPLRNSSLHPGASPSARPSLAGDMSPSFPSLSSPPRQTSMSALSQQLSRTRLSSNPSGNPNDSLTSGISSSNNNNNNNNNNISTNKGIYVPNRHSSSATTNNNISNSNNNNTTSTHHHNSHRAVSTSSMGRTTSSTTDRIVEEENDTVFSMEEDFDEQRKRNSGLATTTTTTTPTTNIISGSGKEASPRLGPIGSGRTSSEFS